MKKNIGIIAKRKSRDAIDAVRVLLLEIDKKKFKIYLEKEIATVLQMKGYSKETLLKKIDSMIVFGGDGTLLSAARLVGERNIPLLGVNLGGLGFITELARDEIQSGIINKILSDKCRYEERIMLFTNVFRKGRKIIRHTALNDIVINKSALARMVELDVYVNNHYATAFKADGLIVSTPTGSTAHSLSAGGPILYPTLESFVMTPICPHSLTNRAIVLQDKSVLEVRIKSGKDVYLTLDGQEGFPLKIKDTVMIKKANFKTKFLTLHGKDYFQILRKKLKWGE
jgi:NAD+ kinase